MLVQEIQSKLAEKQDAKQAYLFDGLENQNLERILILQSTYHRWFRPVFLNTLFRRRSLVDVGISCLIVYNT